MSARRSPSSVSPAGLTPGVGFKSGPLPLSGALAEDGLKVDSFDEGHCIGRYGMVVICVWRMLPTLRKLDAVRRATGEALVEYPGGIGSIGVTEQGTPLMGAAEREAASKLFSDFRQTTRFAAMAIEGDGFWSSSSRSMVTAISLLARVPFPMRSFRYVSDATAWQARFPGTPSPYALADAVERCRAKIGPR